MPVTVPCDYCGKPLSRTPYRINRNKHHFCNRQCKGIWRSEHAVGKQAVHCDWCGKPLEKYPSLIRERNYCNLHCYGLWLKEYKNGANNSNWKGGPITVQCDWCGAPLERQLSWLYERNFCDSQCYANWRSKNLRGDKHPAWKGGPAIVQCAWCGEPLERWRCLCDQRAHFFCNWTCAGKWQSRHNTGKDNPNWGGGRIKYYGPNWRGQRIRAHQRDKICQRCGKAPEENGQALDVHHVVPFRTFGYIPDENDNYLQANDLENLQCLCLHCHHIVEAGH